MSGCYSISKLFKGSSCRCEIIQSFSELVQSNNLCLHLSHAVEILLNPDCTQHFSASRITFYVILLLSPSNLHILCCNSFFKLCYHLTFTQQKRDYNCVKLISQNLTPRLDLQEILYTNPELLLYADGSYAKNFEGKY